MLDIGFYVSRISKIITFQHLLGVDLWEVDLVGVDLVEVDLVGVDFMTVDLVGLNRSNTPEEVAHER